MINDKQNKCVTVSSWHQGISKFRPVVGSLAYEEVYVLQIESEWSEKDWPILTMHEVFTCHFSLYWQYSWDKQ